MKLAGPLAASSASLANSTPCSLSWRWSSRTSVKTSPAEGGPPISLAFPCDSPEDVHRLNSELVQAGFNGHLEPWDAPMGQRYVTIRGPDGNGVDPFARLG